MSAKPKEILETILKNLGFDATIEEEHLEEGPLLRVTSDDSGRLIGRKGHTLVALQYIVNRMIYQQDQSAPKVILDVANYRSQARENLISKAKEAAEKVRRWGDIVELEPLNAFDRYIVHNVLKEDSAIETRSVEVEGTNKKAILLRPRQ
ncbi:MAG: KH domain-containing protein [Verrucomicrobia bacterium]|nr:KH domain-containing protein [Verrucomicrobiota bacterium]MCF7707857.1 KH domain-containing protein [Verrucomicrobiota bacterium]